VTGAPPAPDSAPVSPARQEKSDRAARVKVNKIEYFMVHLLIISTDRGDQSTQSAIPDDIKQFTIQDSNQKKPCHPLIYGESY
jgi:hypothetical protein